MSILNRKTIAAALTFAIAVSAAAQILPLERRMYIFSKTYPSIPLHFAHWRTASYKPEDLDGIYGRFLKRALESENRKDFAFLMREFIALLNNGHSRPAGFSDKAIIRPPTGFLRSVCKDS